MLLRHARSLLFLPASNPRAIAKARTLPCDMVILDLEDAVAKDRKAEALDRALQALGEGFGSRLAAVRINVEGAATHGREMIALKGTAADYVVLPKVEHPKQVKDVFSVSQKPVIAMIEPKKNKPRIPATRLTIARDDVAVVVCTGCEAGGGVCAATP